jgi:hypothetical protein
MTKVQVLQDEIIQLLAWMNERDWDEWDREIEEDAKSGKLDELMEAARQAHREGKSTKF